MQKRPKVAALAVMVKITHHQRGAGCSTTSEMRSVSQLKLRRFRTSGTCAICRSASLTLSGAAAGAPSIFSNLWSSRGAQTARDLPLGDCLRKERSRAVCSLCEILRSAQVDRSARIPIDNRKWKIENSSRCFLLHTRHPDVLRVRHFRVWIANAREITDSRDSVQRFEDP